jgi:SOS-response transcriptional repressor LexA
MKLPDTAETDRHENNSTDEKRSVQVHADGDDALVSVLGIPEADYQCVRVNGSWTDKGLVEGDIVLCADGRSPLAGDIVLLEENGCVRLGIFAEPGFLETKQGSRPIEMTERIIGVGVALARKLQGGSIDFTF